MNTIHKNKMMPQTNVVYIPILTWRILPEVKVGLRVCLRKRHVSSSATDIALCHSSCRRTSCCKVQSKSIYNITHYLYKYKYNTKPSTVNLNITWQWTNSTEGELTITYQWPSSTEMELTITYQWPSSTVGELTITYQWPCSAEGGLSYKCCYFDIHMYPNSLDAI